jgi:hypothetical protein
LTKISYSGLKNNTCFMVYIVIHFHTAFSFHSHIWYCILIYKRRIQSYQIITPTLKQGRKRNQSPMPTCASCIMLTSLAPSPTAKVIGFSGEIFISLITWKTYNKLVLHDKILFSYICVTSSIWNDCSKNINGKKI